MKFHRSPALCALALVGALCAGAAADVIELKDGRKFSGKVTHQEGAAIILTDDGASVQTSPDNILKITQSSALTAGDASAAEWKRLQMQIPRAPDLQTIIALHETFLKRNSTSPLAPQATESLQKYKTLADEGGVKVRSTWLGKTELDALKQQWETDGRPARGFYEVGHLKEALDAVKIALAKDDLNQVALTIGGLAAYRLSTTGVARMYFTSLSGAVFPSVITENNLAVIYFSEKQQQTALFHYNKALQIMPANRLLIDNIAEALHAYTDDKTAASYKTLTRLFAQASARMEAEMNKKGMRRWGSTWVKQAEYERLAKLRTNIQSQMAKLDTLYRSARATLANLDDQVAQAQLDLDTCNIQIANIDARIIEAQNPIGRRYDTSGLNNQHAILAQQLTTLQSKLSSLQAQRGKLNGTIEGYRAQADELKKQLNRAQAQFTGTQRIMELGEDLDPPPPVPVDTPDSSANDKEEKPAVQ